MPFTDVQDVEGQLFPIFTASAPAAFSLLSCNPIHTSQEVKSIDNSGTYFSINMNRTTLLNYSSLKRIKNLIFLAFMGVF